MLTPDQSALLDLYDDLAVEVVDDATPNTEFDLPYSNREIAENVCQALDEESFDLLSYFDFAQISEEGNADVVLAHAFISFLRWRLFTLARMKNVGASAFSESCAAYSEFWYIRLVDRWAELTGRVGMKPWSH